MRLALELLLFASAVWAFYDAGAVTAAWVSGAVTLLHYLASYDRILLLLKR